MNNIPERVLTRAREMFERIISSDDCVIHEPTVQLRKYSIVVGCGSRIDSFCKLEGGNGEYPDTGIVIGAAVHIASFCHLNIGGGLLVLEDGSACASGVKIITASNAPAPGRSCSAVAPGNVVKRSFVHVKRNATLFAGVIVLPGVTIGEGVCVAAGSVVTKDVPDCELWGGIPAHYLKRIGADYPRLGDTFARHDHSDDHSDARFVEATRELYDDGETSGSGGAK